MSDAPLAPRVSSAYGLKDLHVDPALGVIRGPAGTAHLEPRVMALLQALSTDPGTLITRRELLARLWPGGETYDEALTQCVYQLRQQLVTAGGSDDYRRLVTTVSKRGYFLKAEITTLVPRPKAVRTLAVLPFLPLLEEQRDPALELGMADTLITHLGSIRHIVVRPLISVRKYTDLGRDALLAGREVEAEAVLDGSIHRVDDTLRVNGRLLRVVDGSTLWSGVFDANFANIFRIQDDICAKIVAGMVPGLGRDEKSSLSSGGTTSVAAYEIYLKARFHLARLTQSEMLASIDHFRRAVELDPGYALAWSGMAHVLFRIAIAGELRPRDFFPQAKTAVKRALELDDSISEAHAVLGWISHWYDWNWKESEVQFRRAIELNPNDIEGHLGYAHLLVDTGRPELALVEVRKARELSPLYLLAAALEGQFLFFAGRYNDALEVLRTALQMDEGFWLTRVFLGTVLDKLGRSEEALQEIRRSREFSAYSTYAVACEISVLVCLGRRSAAEGLLTEMIQRAAAGYVPPYHLALAYVALDDVSNAIRWLERGIVECDPKMALLASEPRWKRLRFHPEYLQIVRRLGLESFA